MVNTSGQARYVLSVERYRSGSFVCKTEAGQGQDATLKTYPDTVGKLRVSSSDYYNYLALRKPNILYKIGTEFV